jgi:uridylate kinase
MFKATKVDGVYSDDPVTNPKAVRFSEITYSEVLERKLGIMDLTAITLAEKEKLPLVVFNMTSEAALEKVADGDFRMGTLIKSC